MNPCAFTEAGGERRAPIGIELMDQTDGSAGLNHPAEGRSGCRIDGSCEGQDRFRHRSAEAGLSHLNICELEQDLGEEGIVPTSLLELSTHGAL